MLSDIENGLQIDYILVYKLSRFGRNAADILNSLEFIQSYGINLICIEEGIDSSQASGKLLISVLSAVAEIERENIKQRQAEGIRVAKRNGVRFGRPEREIPEEFDRIYELWKNEKISKREAARQLHTNHNTFSNWIKRQEK